MRAFIFKTALYFIAGLVLAAGLGGGEDVTAQSAGQIKLVTGADLADEFQFGDLDSIDYVSDEPGTDLEEDAFGVVFVVVEDDDATANVQVIINDEDISAQANGVTQTFTVAQPPIVDRSTDGVVDRDDVTFSVNLTIWTIDSVNPESGEFTIFAAPPIPGDFVAVSYRTSVVDQLVDDDDEPLLTATSASDSNGISVAAGETDLAEFNIWPPPDLSDLDAFATEDFGVFVGAFAVMRDDWKGFITAWVEDNPGGTVSSLESAVVDGEGSFTLLSAAERAELEEQVTRYSGYLGLSLADEAALYLERVLGVNDGDLVTVTYADQSPSESRTATAIADLDAPAIFGVSLEDAEFTNQSLLTFTMSVTDGVSGLPFTDLVELIEITIDGSGPVSYSSFGITNGVRVSTNIDKSAAAVVNAESGENLDVNVMVTASDAVGNTSVLDVTFTIDILPPEFLGALVGWGAAFDEDANAYVLLENDSDWVTLVFDNVVDGDNLTASDISIPGHTIQEILWVESLGVGPVEDFEGIHAAADITSVGGAGMDLALNAADQEARHLAFVRVEAGSFDTNETPTITIDQGDVVDLAGNGSQDDFDVAAADRLWPVISVLVDLDADDGTLVGIVDTSETLSAEPTATLTFDGVGYVLSLSEGDPWVMNVSMGDLGLDSAALGATGEMTLTVSGVDVAGNAGGSETLLTYGTRAVISTTVYQEETGGAAGLLLTASRIFDADSGLDLPDPKIGTFQVEMSYDGTCLSVLGDGISSNDIGITAVNVDDEAGLAIFNAISASGAAAPATLAFVPLRLVGSAIDVCSLDIAFTQLFDTEGTGIGVDGTGFSWVFQRGDARADGEITIADAMFLSQYLAGIRPGCTDEVTLTCVQIVNGSSVRHDDTAEKLTVTDALFVAQLLVELRDAGFDPL